MFDFITGFFTRIDQPAPSITEKLINTLRLERDYHMREIDHFEEIQSEAEHKLRDHYTAATALNTTLFALCNPADRERQEHDAGGIPANFGSIIYTGVKPMADHDISEMMTGLRDQFRAAHAPAAPEPEIDFSAIEAMDLAEDMQREREAHEGCPALTDGSCEFEPCGNGAMKCQHCGTVVGYGAERFTDDQDGLTHAAAAIDPARVSDAR